MKRFTILAVLLVLLGVSTGFALDLKPSVTLAGNETMTLGYDLNTGAIGFNNETDATLTVILVADDSSDTHKGEGAIYGSITISEFDLYWVDGNENYNQDLSGAASAEVNPSVSATLFIPPFSIGLDAPGMSADVVTEIEANADFDDFSNLVLDSIVDNEDALDFVPQYTGYGTSVRYTDPGGLFWAQIDVKTRYTYAGLDPNNQGLAVGPEFSVTFAPVTFGAGAFYGWGYGASPIAFYVSSTLTIPDMGTASLGVDAQYDSAAADPFFGSFFASAQMNFNKEATSFLLLKVLFETVFSGVDNHLDGYVDFEIPSDTLVGPLSVSVIGYFLEMLVADLEYATKAAVGYKVWSEGDMYVKPMVTVSYGKPDALRALAATVVDANGSILVLNPAIEIGLAANPLSTLTFGWSSDNLLLAAEPDAGAITMALKITY
jgi:hypothetical protein